MTPLFDSWQNPRQQQPEMPMMMLIGQSKNKVIARRAPLPMTPPTMRRTKEMKKRAQPAVAAPIQQVRVLQTGQQQLSHPSQQSFWRGWPCILTGPFGDKNDRQIVKQ